MQDKRYIIEGTKEYSPSIGRLLSMMEYTRLTTLEAVEGLTVKELDCRINNSGNSIGCLLYHIACVEEVYQILTFENREPTEDEISKLEVGLNLGETAHNKINYHELAFYQNKLKKVRENTLEKFKQLDDNWLDCTSPFGPKYLANNYFRWFHVFEDELNHRGQIRLMVRHLDKNRKAITN